MSDVTHYLVLRASVAFSSLMSDGVIDIAARITGFIAWNVSSDLRRVTTGHMRQVLPVNSPEKLIDDKAREILINVSRYYFDLGRYPRLIGPNFAEYIDEFSGLEVLFESFDRGKGVIIVSAHLGNPEIVGQAIGQFGLCAGVVSEELRNPLVERYMQKIRSTTGVRFFPTNFNGLLRARRHLRAGGLLALLGDRDIQGNSSDSLFFGAQAPIPDGIVSLAMSTGADVVSFWAPRTGIGKYSLYFKKLSFMEGDQRDDIARGHNMEVLIGEIEHGITQWPEQWFPLSPIWSTSSENIQTHD